LLALPLSAAAQDLFEVYRQAQGYDAVYAAARHQVDAGDRRYRRRYAVIHLESNRQRYRGRRHHRERDRKQDELLLNGNRQTELARLQRRGGTR